MDYSSLFKIKKIVEIEINEIISSISEIEEYQKSLRKEKRNILNIINNPKIINSGSLQYISSIIKNHDLKIDFNENNYASILGTYYMLPNDANKNAVKSLLDEIIFRLDKKVEVRTSNIDLDNERLNVLKRLNESLDGLLNYEQNTHIKAIGADVLDYLLRYILNIPSNIMSDEEKTRAIYEFNIVNLEAIQSKERLVNKNVSQTTPIIEKPLGKIKFEELWAIAFEEIERLSNLYKNMEERLIETEKNQMYTISQEFDISIITTEKYEQLNNYIKNISANFSADYYIRFNYLKNISEWYDLYKNTNKENEYESIFEELRSAVDMYQDYEESLVETKKDNKEDDIYNNIIYLADNNADIVGIDWIKKDSHDYNDSDYRDLENGFEKIKHSSKEKLLDITVKVKGSGIPGVPEAKFRRLRLGTARIIFIDLNNLIDDKFNKYITNINQNYVALNFGQKAGELDIYKSMNIKESPRIPNLLIEFQQMLNMTLENIVNLGIPENDKKTRIENIINNLILENNELFEQSYNSLKKGKERSQIK